MELMMGTRCLRAARIRNILGCRIIIIIYYIILHIIIYYMLLYITCYYYYYYYYHYYHYHYYHYHYYYDRHHHQPTGANGRGCSKTDAARGRTDKTFDNFRKMRII